MTSAPAGRLAGEVVLVTGAAQGIGAAIAEVAAREGARVGALDLAAVDSDAVSSSVRVDITDADALRDAVEVVVGELGPVTVLVNNAGRNAYLDPVTMSEHDWDAVFAVDLKAAWLCARAVLPAMIAARRGSIVNIASLHANLTTKGMFPYAAAKSGLVGLTRSLALEVADHAVRVNAVSPGYIETALVAEYLAGHDDPNARDAVLATQPLGRLGSPAEVAEVVCFLASPAASYVTGSNWGVDGGFGSRFA